MFVLVGENENLNRWKKRSKVPQKIAQKNAQTDPTTKTSTKIFMTFGFERFPSDHFTRD